MNDSIPNELIDRWLSGEATQAERERVDAWVAAEPSRAAMVDALRSALGRDRRESAWDIDAAWQRVRERIEGDTGTAAPVRERGSWVPALRRAAVLAAVLIGGLAVWRMVGAERAVPAGAFAAVVTVAGQRDTVALPDGSTVILAPSSRLAALAVGDTVRAFELSGEAYFSVEPDPDRPFRVRSGEATTEVVGTRFTVRARDGAPVTVAVRDGRVSLSNGPSAITLLAGQAGRVTADRAPELLEGDNEAWLAWLDGVLEFDGDRLGDVVAELSRWFGRDVSLADPLLGDRRVTGRFVTTTPEHALAALSMTLGIPWTARDSAFVLGTRERE
jgi:transmembrane sensor